MYYVIDKKTNEIEFYCSMFETACEYIKKREDDTGIFSILEDVDMETISRIVYVDGECVYKNAEFWKQNFTIFKNNFQSHTVLDILGKPVNLDRFSVEDDTNKKDIASIDGRPGQINYNMQVGKEFVSLFREECILTKFTKESDTSPMIIFEKLTPVITMLAAGAFREAKQFLKGHRAELKDDFLNDERLDKYIAMLDAADAITYATDEDYFYVVPGEE